MKIIYLTTAALLAAAPAAAQPWQGQRTQSAALQIQIDAGVRSGTISQRELPPLRESLRQLSMLERQFSPGGISGRENAKLQQEGNTLAPADRLRILAARKRYRQRPLRHRPARRLGSALRPRASRRAGKQRYMRDRSAAWDDRDDRDGRDDRYGSSSRFEVSSRGDRFAGDARVGQRVSRRMVDLPDQYRDEYRDSDEVYYRYDSDRIYEIDRGNGLILRLFDLIR